jgi:hypothetical protein
MDPANQADTSADPRLHSLKPIELRAIQMAIRMALVDTRAAFFARAAAREPIPSLETDVEPLVDRAIKPLFDILGDLDPARGIMAAAASARTLLIEMLRQDIKNLEIFMAQQGNQAGPADPA